MVAGPLRPRTRLWSGCISRLRADRFCTRYDVDQVHRHTRQAGLVPGAFRWPITIHYWGAPFGISIIHILQFAYLARLQRPSSCHFRQSGKTLGGQ